MITPSAREQKPHWDVELPLPPALARPEGTQRKNKPTRGHAWGCFAFVLEAGLGDLRCGQQR